MTVRIVVVALAALATGASAAVALGGGEARSADFTPSVLAGTWAGTWTNETFNTTGSARFTVTAPGNTRLNFSVDFGGSVFGCTDPPEESDGIPKGTGANTWGAAGFNVTRTGPAFGTQTIDYSHATRTLTGSGQNPSCAVGLTWRIRGTFTDTAFNGSIDITLPGGVTAKSRLELAFTPAPAPPTTTTTPTTPGPPTTPADTIFPTVVTQGYVGSHAGPVPLRWRSKDASGKATFLVTVAAATSAGIASRPPVFTRTLADQVVGKTKLTSFSLLWTPKPGQWWRYCVRATDPAGNRSPSVCSTLKLT